MRFINTLSFVLIIAFSSLNATVLENKIVLEEIASNVENINYLEELESLDITLDEISVDIPNFKYINELENVSSEKLEEVVRDIPNFHYNEELEFIDNNFLEEIELVLEHECLENEI